MKRLLGLLLVMGMVGCGGGGTSPKSSQAKVDEPPVQTVDAPPSGEAALPETPNEPQAKVDEPPAQTVDFSKLVERDGVMYEVNSETPFTGAAVRKYANGQKAAEGTLKDGKQEGLITGWYENGQKSAEATFKDGKKEGLETQWHENGQKKSEVIWKDGNIVSVKSWDEKGNELR